MGNEWYLRTADETFGPATRDQLIEWARMGRIQPGQDVSEDGETWCPAVEVEFLDMNWSIDIGDGTPRGPFNRQAAQALLNSGRLPKGSKLVFVGKKAEEEKVASSAPASPAAPVPSAPVPSPQQLHQLQQLQKELETLRAGLKAAEARANEAERKVAQSQEEARELRKTAAAAEARATAFKTEVDAARKAEADAKGATDRALSELADVKGAKDKALSELADAKGAKDKALSELADLAERKDNEISQRDTRLAELEHAAKASESAYEDRIRTLSEEIDRIPPSARLAADVQTALYAVMTEEAEELNAELEAEMKEIEAITAWRRKRSERLLTRRHEILRRIGTSAEDMTARALKSNPDDPRTAHLRQELDALRLLQERSAIESERKVRDLASRLREKDAEAVRLRQQAADTTVLYRQLQETRELLKVREKELLDERQASERARQQAEASQQALMARLSALEIGAPGATRQSREARSVKLASWMSLKQ